MKILMVLTSHSELGNTGKKTGFWLEEFAAPYYVFLDAGAAEDSRPLIQRATSLPLRPKQPRASSRMLQPRAPWRQPSHSRRCEPMTSMQCFIRVDTALCGT